MKVYVLETGCYEHEAIEGIFSTPEKAMAAWHPVRRDAKEKRTYTWSQDADGDWKFDADWDDAATISEYEVDSDAVAVG